MVEERHIFYGSKDIAPQSCNEIAKKASLLSISLSGAKPKGRNLTPPEVTGEGAFVSGKVLFAVGNCFTVI